jgi:hypothetical protein
MWAVTSSWGQTIFTTLITVGSVVVVTLVGAAVKLYGRLGRTEQKVDETHDRLGRLDGRLDHFDECLDRVQQTVAGLRRID